jgi:hypothetical protein
VHGPNRVIPSVEWGAEKSHDLIADQFIEGAVVGKNYLRGQGIEAVEALGDFGGREPLRQRRKAAHVDK